MKFSAILLGLAASLYTASAGQSCRQCSCSYSIDSDEAVTLGNLEAQGLVSKAIRPCAGGAGQAYTSNNSQNSAKTRSIGTFNVFRLCNNGAAWNYSAKDLSSGKEFRINIVCDCHKSVDCLSNQKCAAVKC